MAKPWKCDRCGKRFEAEMMTWIQDIKATPQLRFYCQPCSKARLL